MGVQKGHIVGSAGVLVASAGIVCMLTIGYTAGGILVGLGVFILIIGVVIQRKSGGWGEPKTGTTLAVYTMMGPVDPIKTSNAETSPTKPVQPKSPPTMQKPPGPDESGQFDTSGESEHVKELVISIECEMPLQPKKPRESSGNQDDTIAPNEVEPGAAAKSANPKESTPQVGPKDSQQATEAADCKVDDCSLLDHSDSKEDVDVTRDQNSDNLASFLGLEKKSNDVMIDGLDCCDGSFDPTTTAPLLTSKPTSIA